MGVWLMPRRLRAESLEDRVMLTVDAADSVEMLGTSEPTEAEIIVAAPGDANSDGLFDQSDIVQVLQAGKYLTGEPADWSEGDWDGNHVFDQHDIITALQTASFSLTAHHLKAAVNTPYKGEGVFLGIGAPIEGLPAHDSPEPVEGATWVLQIYDQGEGNGTHLGKHTVKFSAFLHFPDSGPPIAISDGFGISTAASGDHVFFQWAPGHVRYFPEPPGLPGHSVITGGTGRFQGVTGHYQWATATDSAGRLTFEWDGSITGLN